MKNDAEIILFADVRDCGCYKKIYTALVNTDSERRLNNTTFTADITTSNYKNATKVFNEMLSIIRAKKIYKITCATGDTQTIARILDSVDMSGVHIDIQHYSVWTGRRHLFSLLTLDELQFALYGLKYKDNYIRGALIALFYVFDVELGCVLLHHDITEKASMHEAALEYSVMSKRRRGMTTSEYEVFSSKYDRIIKQLVSNEPI